MYTVKTNKDSSGNILSIVEENKTINGNNNVYIVYINKDASGDILSIVEENITTHGKNVYTLRNNKDFTLKPRLFLNGDIAV